MVGMKILVRAYLRWGWQRPMRVTVLLHSCRALKESTPPHIQMLHVVFNTKIKHTHPFRQILSISSPLQFSPCHCKKFKSTLVTAPSGRLAHQRRWKNGAHPHSRFALEFLDSPGELGVALVQVEPRSLGDAIIVLKETEKRGTGSNRGQFTGGGEIRNSGIPCRWVGLLRGRRTQWSSCHSSGTADCILFYFEIQGKAGVRGVVCTGQRMVVLRVFKLRPVAVEKAIKKKKSKRKARVNGKNGTYWCWHCSAMGGMRFNLFATSARLHKCGVHCR